MTTIKPPAYFPIMLDLTGRKCVVIGGGTVARRKIESLLEAGASITVIAPTCVAMPDGIEIILREFAPADVDDAWLAIAATNNKQVNANVADAASARRIWVNVVDEPQQCTAILPAVIRRKMLCIAVSTSGACPVWARRLRDGLAMQFGTEYGEMIDLLWAARQDWKECAAHLTPAQRKQAWENVLDLPLLELIREGQLKKAEDAISSCLKKAECVKNGIKS